MTADPLTGVSRVRRARRSSTVSCRHYVLAGQVIVCRDGRWICLPCGLASIRAKTSAASPAAPAPTEGENS